MVRGGFCQEALKILKERQKTGQGVLLVGGSGFYLRALIEGLLPALPPIKRSGWKSNKKWIHWV